MTEALWAQVISGFFGLASLALGSYLPYRLRKNGEDDPDEDRPSETGPPATSQPEATR